MKYIILILVAGLFNFCKALENESGREYIFPG